MSDSPQQPASFDSIIVPPEPPPPSPSQVSTENVIPPVAPSGNGGKFGKKLHAGPIVATLLLLLITLPLSIMFIANRNQLSDVRSRASEPYPPGSLCPDPGNSTDGGCGAGQGCSCPNKNNYSTCTCGPNGGQIDCYHTICPINYSCVEGGPNGHYCKANNETGTTGGSTSTPTPIPSGQCDDIKIYKGDAIVTDFGSLKAGDIIAVHVKGTNATKARVRMNGGAYTEATISDNTNTWYIVPNVSVPDGVSSIVIESEVFVNGAWK
jgi:hypothetical protein